MNTNLRNITIYLTLQIRHVYNPQSFIEMINGMYESEIYNAKDPYIV